MIISYLVVKRNFKGKGFIEAVSMLAMAVPGTVLGVVDIGGVEVKVAEATSVSDGADTTVVLRPESTMLRDEGYFPVEVVVSNFMGAYQLYHVMLGNVKLIIHEYNPKDKKIYRAGETAYINFAPGDAHCI